MTVFRLSLSAISALTLSGCLITSLEQMESRELTNQTHDARIDVNKPSAIIVRESDLIMANLTPEQEATFAFDMVESEYARTYVKGVIPNVNNIHPNAFRLFTEFNEDNDWAPSYQRVGRLNNDDRVLMNAGSVAIHTYCGHVNSRIIDSRLSDKTGIVYAELEANKCYQVKTTLENPYMGYQETNSRFTFAEEEIDWWRQCFYETVLEEIPCDSINETRFK